MNTEVEQVLEFIKKEDIMGAEKAYELNNMISIICKFPNGRIYIYNNIPNYELDGPFISIAEAEEKLSEYREIWVKEEEKIERQLGDYTYEITFMLDYDVSDIKKAQTYLEEDDFTDYIKDKVSTKTANKIRSIRYELKTTYYGDIYIQTNSLLDEINEEEVRVALNNFQTNELNDGWTEQEFAINNKKISEFKPLSPYKKLDLKEKKGN